ncbi:MAG: dephospho-CoA kinase [Candidatus Omnitrophota bacterium]
MKKQRKDKRIVIGVTGVFGSGKSTVSRFLKAFGLKIIDADKIAHSYLLPKAKAYKKIVNFFGKGILGPKRYINRKKLGDLVFSNPRMLKRLNSIVHPNIVRDIKIKLKKFKRGAVVLDAPLLLEAGLRNIVDSLIVVIIDRDEHIRRMVKKRRLKKTEVVKRIKTQIPIRRKAHVADFIIDNSGSFTNTKKQVKSILEKIQGGSSGKTGD